MAGIRKRYGKLMMLSLGFMALGVQGQNSPDAQRDLTAKQALSSAATAFSQGQFAEGEVDYRKAIGMKRTRQPITWVMNITNAVKIKRR